MSLAAGAAEKLEALRRTLSGSISQPYEVYKVVSVKDPLIGQLLASRFELIEMIGQGAMAIVYKAKQTAVDRYVAVKIMRPELASDPVQQKRFSREARSLSKLDHPNLLKIFDIGQTPNGRPYFIMEYLKGRSIEKMLEEAGPVAPAFALRMFVQVCDAMDHAHKQGIIHRDLKPENIMLVRCEDDQHLTKVVDFGIVKYTDDQMVSQRLTKTGEVWGSPVYMSPEQCKGEKLDPRSDIYSFGLVMYEALTGEMTFDATKIAAIIVKQIYEQPRPFKEVRPDLTIDPQLEAIVFKCLEKDPTKRYQSMSELRTVLKRALESELKRATKAGSGSFVVAAPGSTQSGAARGTTARTGTTAGGATGGASASLASSRTAQQPAQGAEPAAKGSNLLPVILIVGLFMMFMFVATCVGGFFLWKSMADKQQNGGDQQQSTTDTGSQTDTSSTTTSTGSGGTSETSTSTDTSTTTADTQTTTDTGTQTQTQTQTTTTGSTTIPTPKKHKPIRKHHGGGSGGGGGYSLPPRTNTDILEDFRSQPP